MSDLDATNFREFAQAAIQQFRDEGLIVAALLWARIVGLYEVEASAARIEREKMRLEVGQARRMILACAMATTPEAQATACKTAAEWINQ